MNSNSENSSFSELYYRLSYGEEVARLIKSSPIHIWAAQTVRPIESELNSRGIHSHHKMFIHEIIALRSQNILKLRNPFYPNESIIHDVRSLADLPSDYDLNDIERTECGEVAGSLLNNWIDHLALDN